MSVVWLYRLPTYCAQERNCNRKQSKRSTIRRIVYSKHYSSHFFRSTAESFINIYSDLYTYPWWYTFTMAPFVYVSSTVDLLHSVDSSSPEPADTKCKLWGSLTWMYNDARHNQYQYYHTYTHKFTTTSAYSVRQ